MLHPCAVSSSASSRRRVGCLVMASQTVDRCETMREPVPMAPARANHWRLSIRIMRTRPLRRSVWMWWRTADLLSPVSWVRSDTEAHPFLAMEARTYPWDGEAASSAAASGTGADVAGLWFGAIQSAVGTG